jgi:hypothetical protein
MSVRTAVLLAVVVVLSGAYLSWTAGRLDRLHARVDAAWAALDAQLARRAAAARALAPLLPAAERAPLVAAAQASLEAGGPTEERREAVENTLTRALRTVLPQLPPDADLHELAAAVTRVGLARSFYNTAVKDTRSVRRRRLPRLFRLAGHRAVPDFFEIDDTSNLRPSGSSQP